MTTDQLASRGSYELSLEMEMIVTPGQIYQNWTYGIGSWLTDSDNDRLPTGDGESFRFRTHTEHHLFEGQVISTVPNERIVLAIADHVSDAETVRSIVDVQFRDHPDGAFLVLSHSGLANNTACDEAAERWLDALGRLQDAVLNGKREAESF